MQNLIIKITQENTDLIADSKLQCFILPDSLPQSFIADFCAKAEADEKLVLISGENAADLYLQKLGDGLIIDTSKDENPAKKSKKLKQNAKKLCWELFAAIAGMKPCWLVNANRILLSSAFGKTDSPPMPNC